MIKKTNVTVNISYDVYANVQSVADPFLDDSHAYIATGGILIYPKGQLKHDLYNHKTIFKMGVRINRAGAGERAAIYLPRQRL